MAKLARGIYETIVSEALESELSELADLAAQRESLRSAEAGDRLALHLAGLIESAVDALPDSERVARGIDLARKLIATLASEVGDDELRSESPVENDTILRALLARRPDGRVEKLDSPLIPLLDTTLLTNAPGEPRVLHQLLTEIASAERIDIVMAFVRRSGTKPFIQAFRRHCDAGRLLRVLTTSYTGSTEKAALEELTGVGAEVRISYDTSSTRLHAKAWLFHRPGGVSTAYVGSSNLTHSAQVSGLEWNVRASGARNSAVIEKIGGVFQSYWEGGDFRPFEPLEFDAHTEYAKQKLSPLPPTEIRLEPFQERLLEEITVARERGRHRNLLVAATGTGKTVMAAVDYKRLRDQLKRSRLLFVAHRKELLEQARATFAHALREPDFGELWVGGKRPEHFEHVFASIQSLASAGLADLPSEHFDVVIVDEFHHAAAPSYDSLLKHVQARELLGLTATPERADGLPILDWFDGRISAELRLWDAIDQHRLVPFVYYGIHDGVDLTSVPWKRGTGYDVDGLTKLYTGNDVRAKLIRDQLLKFVDDIDTTRTLGFCVSVQHARFMAKVFSNLGIPSVAVWGETSEGERSEALAMLRRGDVSAVFSVDLFNEGVDLPNVDTLLLLRPTDSPTLFLQQLGRGLRTAEGKHSCLVLDFVGQHRKEFRFDRRLRSLLGGSRKHIQGQVEQAFPFLPAGCHMELDRKSREIVLENIKKAVPAQWDAKAAELRRLADEGRGELAAFLEDSGLDLEDVYSGTRCWSDLQEAAGIEIKPNGPAEEKLRRACGRQLHVDDAERLDFCRDFLGSETEPAIGTLPDRQRRLARMLVASITDQAIEKDATLQHGVTLLWQHPQIRAELIGLFGVLADRIDHHHDKLDKHPGVPLQVHARYTRLEILAACQCADRAKVAPWQTGVYWEENERVDLLAFTLDKTSGQFSPTTRYKDYALSPELIHWESQSATRANSKTGLRYQEHAQQGSSIFLFARERQNERAFWFLGPATYVSHEGERPIAFTWRLKYPLPGDLFTAFAAAVA
jgi:superfamily II DNA or RNA helicase/HKD family nuclease